MNAVVRKLAPVVVGFLAKKLGDKMATAKRPFWRKLVGFFRQ